MYFLPFFFFLLENKQNNYIKKKQTNYNPNELKKN